LRSHKRGGQRRSIDAHVGLQVAQHITGHRTERTGTRQRVEVPWLGLLLDREMTERQDRRLKARLRFARLRHQAIIEDVDYRAPRGLDRALF
jgi:hypothetical protein